jgi:uncharacterized protein (DUF342 family)
MLESLDIRPPFDIAALRLLVSSLSRGRDAADSVIAQGTPAEKGEDGRIEICGQEHQAQIQEEETGRLDYREQSLVQTVRAGQLVARIDPPTMGKPGSDVFGQPLPGLLGSPATLTLGENVRAGEDGSEVYATIDGAISLSGSSVAVKDTFTVRGDVDYSTGNLHLERGSLLIEGDVRPGFRVSAAGDVLVRGASDGGQVLSESDVRIGRGAFGGYVKAGGNAIIRFAQNAHIESEGDVLVSGGVINCEILAGGHVLCNSGKGQIRGGNVRATRGIAVKDLGSEGHVKTLVEIVAPQRVMSELSMRLKGQEDALAKVARHLGNASDEEILARIAKEEREETARMLERRRDLLRRIARLRKTIDSEQRAIRNQTQVRVVVQGFVYVGVIVIIGGAQLAVRDDMKRVQFLYDSERHMVRAVPL